MRTPGTDSWKTSSIVSFPTIGETTEALRIVAGSTSPLRGLVRVVERQHESRSGG